MNTKRFESKYDGYKVLSDSAAYKELKLSMEYFLWLKNRKEKAQ